MPGVQALAGSVLILPVRPIMALADIARILAILPIIARRVSTLTMEKFTVGHKSLIWVRMAGFNWEPPR